MCATLLAAAVTSFFWSRYPYTRGSYTSPKVGQYTTMLDEAGKPALNGRLQFAGEHTCAICRRAYLRRKLRRLYGWRRAQWKPHCR
jgi:hypothetical protein